MSQTCRIVCVLLPFAAGYYLSYLFRTINALIASDLTAELNLTAADLGLLTSVYFLVFAAVQLPFGALLDRHGPKVIQSALLLLASAGSLLFALADGMVSLMLGRALLGVGVALALMAGFKAIVVWFPPGRAALANGWLVMLGALGAVTATAPAELVVNAFGWRGLFAVLAGLAALAALLVLFAVPDRHSCSSAKGTAPATSLWAIYRDRRFWRMAPLSAVGIGTSWSLQGLWAAPWLRDVDGLDRAGVVQNLSAMAISVCTSALLLGIVADRLRRSGGKTETVLASTLMASMAAQVALLLRWPVPSLVVWTTIAAAGAATVLSFAILGDYFPKEMSGRANAALNLLHVGGAFVLQSATGFVIAQWPEVHGTYPVEAHQTAMAITLLLQLAALAWFAMPQRSPTPLMVRAARQPALPAGTGSARRANHCTIAVAPWRERLDFAHGQVTSWRLAAIGSAILCFGLTAALSTTISRPTVAIHVLEPNWPGRNLADHARSSVALIARSAIEGPAWPGPRFPPASMWPEPIAIPRPVMLRATTPNGSLSDATF